jgi:hypothetical protein
MTKRQVPAADVRQWANKKGFDVGTRGHLPQNVIEKFNRAHPSKEFVSGNPWLGRQTVDA